MLPHREKIRKEFLKQKSMNPYTSKPGIHEFIIVLDHLKPNYNIGKIFRSAEAFGAKEIHVVGTKEFNPYPSKGGFRHVPCFFYPDIQGSLEKLFSLGYHCFAFDLKATQELGHATLPSKSAFFIGHEFIGLTFQWQDYAQKNFGGLKIPQFGKTQSLNAAVAASIAMYEYCRQHIEPVMVPPSA